LYQRYPPRQQAARFVWLRALVVVGAQDPAQLQPLGVQHGVQHDAVAAARIDQHSLARRLVAQQVAEHPAGFVVQDPKQHGQPPAAASPPASRVPLTGSH